jgi:hypothetical protein
MQDGVATAAYLREQAERCVRLASGVNDPEAATALRNMAMQYQTAAERLERGETVERPNPPPPPDVSL